MCDPPAFFWVVNRSKGLDLPNDFASGPVTLVEDDLAHEELDQQCSARLRDGDPDALEMGESSPDALRVHQGRMEARGFFIEPGDPALDHANGVFGVAQAV